MTTFDTYTCPGCGHVMHDIDMATIDDYRCPVCMGVPLAQFVFKAGDAEPARKRKEAER